MSYLFNDSATTEIYTYWHTLALHDALPISPTDELSSDAHQSPDVRECKMVVPATSGTWGITGEVLVLSRTPTIALDDRMTCQVSLQFSGGRDEAAAVTP